MKITIKFDPDYLGSCAVCGKNDATHAEWVKFDQPVKIKLFDYPDIKGIWHHVCDNCCDKINLHK